MIGIFSRNMTTHRCPVMLLTGIISPRTSVLHLIDFSPLPAAVHYNTRTRTIFDHKSRFQPYDFVENFKNTDHLLILVDAASLGCSRSTGQHRALAVENETPFQSLDPAARSISALRACNRNFVPSFSYFTLVGGASCAMVEPATYEDS